MMRAIRVHEVGGPEVLTYEEVPSPGPGPGQVLVKTADAIGVLCRICACSSATPGAGT